MRLGTHDGSFHADDCCAVAVVQLAHPDETVEIVRTREQEALDGCDLRIDVGFRHDPATGDFDHHQAGGAGQRPDGVAYASFGLVWAHFGAGLCARLAAGADPALLHARVDEALVAGIDANDVGLAVSAPAFDGAPGVYGLASVLGALNLAWDEPGGAEAEQRAFAEAVAVARRTIEREITQQAADLRAESLVRAAIDAAADPRIVELDRDLPWIRPVHEHAPEALYVVYPKTKGWAVQAVRLAPDAFPTRKPLPEAWAGLQAEDLAAVSGVPDAVFCHSARFLTVAASREGAHALAQAALAA
jgi:uncharacterized UPF0160 family protein